MSIISTQLISALNNYNSITPIVTKDLTENFGRTAMAYHCSGEKTRKYEAKEKFIEANMSSFVWYGVIPLIKKIFDLTAFKSAKLNPDISLKFLDKNEKVQNIYEIQKKITKGDLPKNILNKNKLIDTKTVLNNIEKNTAKYKGLHVSRMLLSTIISAYISVFVLPKAIISMTKRKLDNEKNDFLNKKEVFKEFGNFKGKKAQISFKSLGTTLLKKASEAQSSLLGDMVAVDLAISGSRIYYADKREKEALKGKKTKAPYAAALEKLIREGGFLYLIYFGGKHIKNGIDKLTKNNFDPLVLEDKNFVNELKSGLFKKNPLKNLNEKQTIDFIDKNINNDKQVFIKYAKKMKLIDTVKDGNGKLFRNPFKYVDIENLKKHFDVMAESAGEFLKNGKAHLEKYVSHKAKTKRLGIYGNLAAGSFLVCFALPKIVYGFRKWYTGNNEEPGIINVMKNS